MIKGVWLNDVMDWVEQHLQDRLENEGKHYRSFSFGKLAITNPDLVNRFKNKY